MRLSIFHEAKDSLHHDTPEIKKILLQYQKDLEALGFKQKPYENDDGYKFAEDDSEAMAFFTDGILDFVILVSKDHDNQYRVFLNLELKRKYSADGKLMMIAQLNLVDVDLDMAIKALDDALVQIKKVEGFFDWVLDVTGKFPGIKFKTIKSGLSAQTWDSFAFTASLAAIGGEYIFHANGDNPKERIYFQ